MTESPRKARRCCSCSRTNSRVTRSTDVSDFDPKRFYDDMVAAGLLLPVRVPGAFGRGAKFEDVLQRLDALALGAALGTGAESMMFPPVIDRSIVERTGYMESFPNLCGTVHSFVGAER